MDRNLSCLLVATLTCLTVPSAARDCLECWRDACASESPEDIDGNFQTDCCNCVENQDDCIKTVHSEECCTTAESNLLTVFSINDEPSEVCDSSNPYPFTHSDDLHPVGGTVHSLSPGTYILPNITFNCSGCIEEVQVQGQVQDYMDNSSITVTINLLIWSRLELDDDDNDGDEAIFKVKRNFSITTSDIEPEEIARYQQTITLTLPEDNLLCFERNEELGLYFEESSDLQIILADAHQPVYEAIPSTAETCANLENYYSASAASSNRSPIMAVRIRSLPLPSSESPSLLPSSVSSTISVSLSTSTRISNPSPTLSSPSATQTPPETATPISGTESAVSLQLIVGVGAGLGALVIVIAVVIVLALTIILRHSNKDNIDGKGKRIARVRSINMDRRLQQQQHSQAVTNSVGQTGEPFYDYPLAQLHPYHDLEGPTVPRQNTMGNYTTMQPAGSIREGAITPVGNGSHTIRSIYDDDLSQGDAALQNGAPQRPLPQVQDTPFYHVLDQPGQINGEMVAQIGYDDPVELVQRQGNREEIVNPIYREIEDGPQKHLQMIDPSNGHPYHMLEESNGGREIEVVEGHGLYVPTAEERRRICDNNTLSASDMENWIKKSRLESTKKRHFFESTSTYWKPPSDADSLYNTLAQRKYREILSDQIQIVKFVGSGQFGTVNLAVWTQQFLEPMEVAVKVCRAGKNEAIKTKFLKEAAIMGQFHHPNVVKLYGVVTMSELPMIVLELMKNGDMLDYMKKNFEPGRLPPPSSLRLLSFSRQVACGMEYLANKSFVHRDLAARNILLNELHQCKIGDFGMARDLEDSEYYIMSRKGPMPLKWTAPEALNYRKYSTFSDCYSYGMVLYEIWSVGREPLPGISIKDVPDLINKGYCQPPPPGCPRSIYELMVKLWNPKKRQRPTFPAIVEYLKQPEEHLLTWSVEDRTVSSQASVLGAPLDEGKKLYVGLQNAYQSSWC